MNQEVNSKKDWLKYAKIFCLLTPTIISLIILILVGVIVFGRYFSPYTIEIRVIALETMVSTIFTLIGVAVTVWIALNIYNIISKDELEFFKEETRKKIEEITLLYENKLEELYESIDEKINSKIKEFHIQENNELIMLLDLYDDDMCLKDIDNLIDEFIKKADEGKISRSLATLGSMELGFKKSELEKRKLFYDEYFELYNKMNLIRVKEMSVNDLKIFKQELADRLHKVTLMGYKAKNNEFLLTEDEVNDFRKMMKYIQSEIDERDLIEK